MSFSPKATVIVRALEQADHREWLPMFEDYGFDRDPVVVWRKLFEPTSALRGCLATYEHHTAVGFVHYFPHECAYLDDRICYIADLYIKPAFRNLGIGKMLMEEVFADARLMNWPHVYWVTGEKNPARHLYDKYTTADCVGYQIKVK